tara:strand:+ start:10087 stop:11481 length:1395 start_codon:yes stop_codon:yes gene_type:complete
MGFIDDKLCRDPTPLLVTSSSAVFTGTYDGNDAIIKCFNPRKYGKYRKGSGSKPAVPHEGGYRKSSGFYFDKDAKILYCLNKYSGEDSIVPEFYNVDIRNMSIIMERVQGDTFATKFREYGGDIKNKRIYQRRMLEHVAKFHEFVNRDEVREELRSFSYKGKPLVELRGLDELKGRLTHQIRILICKYSVGYKQKYGDTERSSRDWPQTKRCINRYLDSHDYTIKEVVNTILENHIAILYDDKDPFSSKQDLENLIDQRKISVVHGDFNPANVIYRRIGHGKVFDFDEVQLAHSALDVVHALYHRASSPTESRGLDLLEQYRNNPEVNYMEPWDSLLPTVVETRFMRFLEIIAGDGKRTDDELRSMEWLAEPGSSVQEIRMKNFNQFTNEFIPLFLYGEGYNALSQVPPSKVTDQLYYFRQFFNNVIKSNKTGRKSSMVRTFERIQKGGKGRTNGKKSAVSSDG